MVNANIDEQLHDLIKRSDLLGIIDFLESIGIQLDDHYLGIRQLVRDVPNT